MFNFRRRTLWIMIYLLIPLVFLLHRVGEEELSPVDVVYRDQWSLDAIEVERDGDLRWVHLPDAQQWRLTVVQRQAPATELGLGLSDAVLQNMQGGYWLVTLANPVASGVMDDALSFLSTWLPDGTGRQWVLTGPVTDDILSAIRLRDSELQGEARPLPQAPDAAMTPLTSPPVGSEAQVAFLLWIGVLQQRLGDSVELRWDHRFETSRILLNQSLNQALFEPVTAAEFDQVMSVYREAAAMRQRTAEQIHGALVLTAVYGLSPDFMLNQPERLAAIDLGKVNRQRERSQREQFE